MEKGIALFLIIVVLYALVSKKLTQLSISMPLVFVIAGAITEANALNLIDFSFRAAGIETLTEITLALLLFADASTLSFRRVSEDRGLPGRLLLFSLPLTMILGALVAFIFFHEHGIWFAFLLASILAPTDSALGLSILNNPLVPVRIRRALNVESGLNDGIVSPFVTLFIALAIAEENLKYGQEIISALAQIGIAVGIGILFGIIGGRLFIWATKHDITSTGAEQIGNLSLALGTFFCSVVLGGNGFVAVFIAGLLFGYTTHHQRHLATEFTEVAGTLLSTFVWFVFGGSLVLELFISFNPLALLYGLLSLTVIRMLPVALSLAKTRFRTDTVLIMGWFGPRGLASVVFLLMAYEAFYESGYPHELMFAMAGWTILLSVILHGFTALPLANLYARRLQTAPPESPEFKEVPEAHSRRKMLSHGNLLPPA